MNKRKKITSKELILLYMNDSLENNKTPDSLYLFCKKHQIEEKEFYSFYASLELLESSILSMFFENTTTLLKTNCDFQGYDSRNKLLSFYFTFFENLTANRSFILLVFKESKSNHALISKLKVFRKAFFTFLDELNIESIDFNNKMLEQIQQKSIHEAIWIQFLSLLKFWIDDDSPSFEKTDLLIEKSTHAGFDVLNLNVINSVVDLGKFLFKEKIKTHF
jgi:hypothetical protein